MRGFAAHKAGRLAEATKCYEQVLAHDPDEPHALRLLGEIALRTGRPERAIEFTRRSLVRNPASAEAYNNLGAAYRALGRLDEAEASLQCAIRLDPGLAVARTNLGAVLLAKGKIEAARDTLTTLVTIAPDSADAWMNLGVVEHRAHALPAAEHAFRRATELAPHNAGAWSNLGAVLVAQERQREGLAALDRAAELSPKSAELLNYRGNILRTIDRLEEAVQCYLRAIDIQPDFSESYYNLGLLLSDQWQFAQATTYFHKAIELNPRSADAMNGLGSILRKIWNLTEALAWFDRALEIDPRHAAIHGNRGMALVNMGRIEEGLQALRTAITLNSGIERVYSNYLFTLNYAVDVSPDEMLAEHRRFDAEYGNRAPPLFANARDPGKRLRVAYVSGDFHGHPCAFFIEPLLANHDPARIEVFCYSTGRGEKDDYTSRLKALAHQWRDVAFKSDGDLQALALNDGIDIAVDLAGHTAGGRPGAFARRLAPVQVAWLGYPATTGLAAMDYRLTDTRADPSGTADGHCSERLVRLPETFLCYRPPAETPDVAPVPAMAGTPFTFGSFNNLSKINRHVTDAWIRILRAVPQSRLLIKSSSLGDSGTRTRLAAIFAEGGVEPSRIELVPWIHDRASHLALYGQVDLALDTFPYNGTTTTCEALWMGVPVLTVAGDRHAARVGVSLLAQLGLDDFVTPDIDAYVAAAVAQAKAPARLTTLRAELRGRMQASPLRDERRFAANVEQAYCEMWRTWCDKA